MNETNNYILYYTILVKDSI